MYRPVTFSLLLSGPDRLRLLGGENGQRNIVEGPTIGDGRPHSKAPRRDQNVGPDE